LGLNDLAISEKAIALMMIDIHGQAKLSFDA